MKDGSVLISRERKIFFNLKSPPRRLSRLHPPAFSGSFLQLRPTAGRPGPGPPAQENCQQSHAEPSLGRPVKFDQGAALRRGPWAANADHCEARPCRIQTWVTRCFSLLSTKFTGLGFIPSVSAPSAWAQLASRDPGASPGLPAAIAGSAAPEMRPHEPAPRRSPRHFCTFSQRKHKTTKSKGQI